MIPFIAMHVSGWQFVPSKSGTMVFDVGIVDLWHAINRAGTVPELISRLPFPTLLAMNLAFG